MRKKTLLKALVPLVLTFAGLEVGSRLIAYQPISTTWRELQENGVATNVSNQLGLHEHWGNGIQKYAFGDFANRISLNGRKKQSGLGSSAARQDPCKILVLGDSYSFGWLVAYEDAFPAQIARKLNIDGVVDGGVEFINAAAGGWGLADYPAYLASYKNKLAGLDLKGIIVFVNSDDGRRAAASNLYDVNRDNGNLLVTPSNYPFVSRAGIIKRILNHPLVAPIYSFSQQYSNVARIGKQVFFEGKVRVDPRRSNQDSNDLEHVVPGQLTLDSAVNLSEEAKAKINRSVDDLRDQSLGLAPVLMVYTGVSPLGDLSIPNRYVFSKEFVSKAKKHGIEVDFSTIPDGNLYSAANQIKYDGHPDAAGHRAISNQILNSTSKHSLAAFTRKVCSN